MGSKHVEICMSILVTGVVEIVVNDDDTVLVTPAAIRTVSNGYLMPPATVSSDEARKILDNYCVEALLRNAHGAALTELLKHSRDGGVVEPPKAEA
jgi:hypothetical protein